MPIHLDEHNPTSLEEAIHVIYSDLNLDETLDIREHGAERYHHSVGTAIRNSWIHPEGSILAKNMIEKYEWLHADDMSGLILEGLTAKVRGEIYDPLPTIAGYKEHWRRCGIDPQSGEDRKVS